MYDAPQHFRWRDPSLPPSAPALQVFFVEEPKVNDKVTAETGVQSYDNVLVAYVSPMGMAKSNVAKEIERTLPDGTVIKNAENSAKYAEQVKHYKAGTDSAAVGTPLKDLIGMTPAIQMNLRARGIHTIEMLGDMPDAAGNDFMGFWDLRDRAKKHLETREKNAPMVRMEAIEKAHKEEVDSLKRQLADLAAKVAEVKPAKKAA